MKTFPNWRLVGRAMRWARQQEGVTVKPPPRGISIRTRRYIGPGGTRVHVTTIPGATWFKTFSGVVGSTHVTPENASQALRVLAALDLIPAHLAYGPDERYGRCEVPGCKRIARWWPAEAWAAARWVHEIANDERFVDYPNHQAVVAE